MLYLLYFWTWFSMVCHVIWHYKVYVFLKHLYVRRILTSWNVEATLSTLLIHCINLKLSALTDETSNNVFFTTLSKRRLSVYSKGQAESCVLTVCRRVYGLVHTGRDTRQYTYLFFIKFAILCRQFYKEHIGILSRVASSVNRPYNVFLTFVTINQP